MKKVIGSKIYDTETAEELHHYVDNWPVKRVYEAKLYKTQRGNFFLWTKSTFGIGEQLHPITEEEALTWLEEKGGDEVLLSRFPDKVSEA